MLQSEIAQQIAKQVNVSLTPAELEQLTIAKTVEPEAYQAYLQGNYFLWSWYTEAGLRKALASYRKAISLDSTHAVSHAGLGYAYGLLANLGYMNPEEAFRQARTAVEKALRLDLNQVEVRSANAMLKFWFERDWAGADREFRQALALNKNSAQLYSDYASFLAAMGRNDEAVSNARQALSLDPVSQGVNLLLGKAYHAVGDYDHAIEQHRETIELFGRFILPRVELALAYCAMGRFEDALQTSRLASSLTSASDPAVQASLGYVYAVSGKPEEARATINHLEGRADTAYVDAIHFAVIEAGLGNRARALGWLTQAAGNNSPQLAFLRVLSRPGNVFASLRNAPEFRELLAKMKLPEETGRKQVTRVR